jgi:hypothetical protein
MISETIDAELILTVITGVAWTIVYINAIWIGFRQKTFAIPLLALAINFAWELTYVVFDLKTAVAVPNDINVAWAIIEVFWALFDLLIVYTFFRFGRSEFPSFLTKRMFVAGSILVFGAAFAVQWLFIAEFGTSIAVDYSGFLQNLLMSGLFIAMFFARRGLRGQSLTIAIAKWVGTLAPTILYGAIAARPFILGLGIMCGVFDVAYIGLVVWAKTRRNTLAATGTPAADRDSSVVVSTPVVGPAPLRDVAGGTAPGSA